MAGQQATSCQTADLTSQKLHSPVMFTLQNVQCVIFGAHEIKLNLQNFEWTIKLIIKHKAQHYFTVGTGTLSVIVTT